MLRYTGSVEPEAPELDPFKAAQIADEAGWATKGLLLGLFGAPYAAWLWKSAADLSRALDAGRVSPRGILNGTQGFFSLVVLWGHDVQGTGGLHVVFGLLVAAVEGIGFWGWAKRRSLNRQYGARSVRDASRTALLQENKQLAERVEAEMQRRQMHGVRRRGTTGGMRLLGLLLRLVPIASIVTTVALAAAALLP